MNIKFVKPDGSQYVYGDVTNYVVTKYQIQNDKLPNAKEGPEFWVRMFRGIDVNTYGPFDQAVYKEDWMYVMDSTGKTIDTLFGLDTPFTTLKVA